LILIDQDNHGASHARNQGLKIANGKFIALLDGDDLWDQLFLETISDAISKSPNEFIFTTAIAHKYDNLIVPVSYSFKMSKSTLILDYFEASQDHSILSGSSAVFKKSILSYTGHFDESIKSGQDTDLWIRFGIHHPVIFINKVMVHYVYNETSLSNTTINLNDKPNYNTYNEEEKNNVYLKKYLDRNRFSLAILSKLNNDQPSFTFYKQSLNIKNLSFKRRILLYSPKWLVTLLLKLKALGGKKTYYQSF
ncbi:MAG: glycosyltransferase involved in cell wall biosynthesis, partial [Psychroserpens sp.]